MIISWYGIRKYPFDDPCRIAGLNCHSRNILCHHTTSSHNGSVTNLNARQYRGIYTYPNLIHVMVNRNQIHFRSDKHLIAYRNPTSSEKCAALLDKASFTDPIHSLIYLRNLRHPASTSPYQLVRGFKTRGGWMVVYKDLFSSRPSIHTT